MKAPALATILILIALLAGCGGGEPEQSQSDSQSSPAAGAEAGIAPDAKLAPAPAEGLAERQEVTTGSVSLTAADPVDTGRTVVRIVENAGGRVDDRTERPRTDDTEPSSSLTVRIPADRLTATLDEISGLGEVTGVSVSRSDVTMQTQDLDARIGALQASVTRLQGLIATAANTADLIEAENALSQRQAELDSLVAQRRALADQVELATISIDITTDGPGSADPDSFWDGVVAGWHALLSALHGLIVFLGRAVPWVGFLALVVLVGYALVRLVRRR
ncbi:DUF4349 domain-containing protein [Rhodococcus maanshanensis]|uniref:DUF4349 domain-containing protein n=1 Tax=Rhodococcus maanshanensis TaxID=183556 RepID=A0A1H7KGL1_9NOCA|nr:DUF4349 domain-containing protein [Rhodococcus maanshanensis]SEK85115.1 protein of unknown function [Rhodococcus maanshanensis]